MAPQGMKSVDKLTITFVVDNCIEWMTKLPPGFILEVPQHLSHPDVPRDPLTGVPFLDLENYCCGAHGFSALIETEVKGSDPYFTLFDTGPDSRSIVRNIEALKLPVERVTRIILSHWHSDHSGGMLSFLRYRQDQAPPRFASRSGSDSDSTNVTTGTPPCIVDLHPDRPIARGIAPASAGGKVIGRLAADPTFEEIAALGGVVETHAEGHAVAGGTMWVSGEISRVTHFEGGLPGGVRWVEKTRAQGEESGAGGEWVKEEDVMDERYAVIDVVGKGLVIFSACSHAGIVNVVKDAVDKFSRPVYMIVGGLHLAGTELADRLAPTVNFLANKMRPSPTYVLPMHCTGFAAKVALEDALGEGCVPAGVGHKVVIEGTPETERMIYTPTVG
ncbi:beta-lactamase-like protein [Trametes meyenii]|nr:beta-lactamase-like protein [Trametes meyenii]